MKKSGKFQIGKIKPKKSLPTHKEIVAKITEENRAFFDKNVIEGQNIKKYPHQITGVSVDEIGTRQNLRLDNPKPKIQIRKVLSALFTVLLIIGLFVGFVGVLVVIAQQIFIPSSGGWNPPAQTATPNYGFDRVDEYIAAKNFIKAQYPGAQTFSSCDDSTVQASPQGDCIVKIAVGGVNAFNAPIRDTLTVFMKFQEGKFGLQRIDSQNDAALVQQQIKDGY